jgi:hypothetical protein
LAHLAVAVYRRQHFSQMGLIALLSKPHSRACSIN